MLMLFIWGRWRYDLVALAALLLVFICGLAPPEQLFLGFGHPAVITVAAVLVISRGLLNAGVIDAMSRQLSRVGGSLAAQLGVLTAIVIFLSGFMNNVGALALLMPVAVWMSGRSGRSPSMLLMPLAFGSLLGGLITLIGTPPNIIIAMFREQTGQPAFGMFDFSPVGLCVAAAGLVFIVFAGPRLTPRKESGGAREDIFEIEKYITEIVVPENSKFVGHTLFHLISAIEKEADIQVVGIIHGDRIIGAPSVHEEIEAGDMLMIEAAPEEIKTVTKELGLDLVDNRDHIRDALGAGNIELMEVIVSADSSLRGKSAAALHLRNIYGVNLLAIARRRQRLVFRLGHTEFIHGDILLLQGAEKSLQAMIKDFKCLPLADRGISIGRTPRVLMAAGLFGAAMLLSAFNVVPVQVAFVAAAVIMVLAGLVPVGDMYESIDWPIIVLLGAMFPLGHALESTGGAGLIAQQLLVLSNHLPPVGTVATLLTGTMLLSNVVNNAAAAVLMAPIAITLAAGMGVSADPLLMAVAVGASCAFMTPVGHQSNALVMAPGGYSFGDYWKLGLPLTILVAVVAAPLIMVFWPMNPA